MTALDASWNSTNPASVTLYTDLFDEELLYTVRHMPGVREADARRQTTVRFQNATYLDAAGKSVQALTAPDEAKWRNLSLYSYPDYESISDVGKVWPQSGAWPPPERQVLIERASLAWMGAQIGDTVLVKAWDGRLRELRIAGTVHDPGQMQASWNGTAIGYVDRDTMDWLGVSRNFDELHVIAAAANPTRSELTQLAQALRSKVEKSGRTVYYTYIPTPGKHPAGETVEPMLMILGVLGFLALVLSGLLVVNTMQALLTQQVRQMGIMKAVGARNSQIMGIYCGMVVAFGVLALTVAVPLGALGAQGLTQYMAGLLNFNIEGFDDSAAGVGPGSGGRAGRAAARRALPDHHGSAHHAARGDERLRAGGTPLTEGESDIPVAASPPVRAADPALAAQHLPAQGPAGADPGDPDPGRRDLHRRVQRAGFAAAHPRQHVSVHRLRCVPHFPERASAQPDRS